MKKIYTVLLTLWMAACAVIPSPNPSSENLPAILEITQTPATATPILSTATTLPIAIMTSAPTLAINPTLQQGKPVNINSIHMMDTTVGWALDSTYHILRTTDSGSTWRDVTPPTGLYQPAGFFAFDANIAWATFFLGLYSGPETAYVWYTNDGGDTWKPSQEFRLDVDTLGRYNPADYYFPNMIHFIDLQNGWLLVNVYSGMHSTRPLLFKTSDGGVNWVIINDHGHDLLGGISVGFAFLDEQTGWYGQNDIPLRFGKNPIDDIVSTGGWKLIKTSDGGRSFPDFTLLPLPAELQQPEFAGKNADCGETRILTISTQVIGVEWRCDIFMDPPPEMFTNPPLRYSFFALTSDRGSTWNSFLSSGNEYFLNATHGWRLLSPGQLQQTTDSGLTWTTLKTVAWENAQFDFVSEEEGWAIVTNAGVTALVHTVDGGETWEEIKPVITSR